MIREAKVLKDFDVTCDYCGVTQKVQAYEKPSRVPAGWGYKTEYCGDHYCDGHSHEVCPGCVKKYNVKPVGKGLAPWI